MGTIYICVCNIFGLYFLFWPKDLCEWDACVAVGGDGGTILQNYSLCIIGQFAGGSILTLQGSLQGAVCRAFAGQFVGQRPVGPLSTIQLCPLLCPNLSDLKCNIPVKPVHLDKQYILTPIELLRTVFSRLQATVWIKLLRIICHWLGVNDLICNNASHPWAQEGVQTSSRKKEFKIVQKQVQFWIL